MKVLYVCTHNRCRSILSEAITNHLAGDRIIAKSAGSQPSGEVHPLSLKYLQEAGIPTQELQSQSWEDFDDFEPDLVITVCDSAAGEACPLWMGSSLKLHWGLSDPSKVEGDEDTIANSFRACIAQITERVKNLRELAGKSLTPSELKSELNRLGAK
uniref:arsenate reductase ArsC n=1 Tax=Ningiella ruwaisensis TaxID=2364274 RepID=UPI00109F0A03|nr:arsenate reductase ArsC [Ningiella ruwaisensis]